MTIELNGTINVDCGKGILFAVELNRIHPDMREHMLTRGLKPCLQDVHASVTLAECDGDEAKQRELSLAAVSKYVEACYAGTARVRGVRSEVTSDPMSKLRIAALREMFDAKHGAGAFAKLSKRDDKADVIKKLIDKNADKIESRALEMKAEAERAKAKAANAVADMDLDL